MAAKTGNTKLTKFLMIVKMNVSDIYTLYVNNSHLI